MSYEVSKPECVPYTSANALRRCRNKIQRYSPFKPHVGIRQAVNNLGRVDDRSQILLLLNDMFVINI